MSESTARIMDCSTFGGVLKNRTAEGLHQGNKVNRFLDELDKPITRWKACSPTCQRSSCSPLETSKLQEGMLGGRLDVKQCDRESLVPKAMVSMRNLVCLDATRFLVSHVTRCVDPRHRLSGIRNLRCVERHLKLTPQHNLHFVILKLLMLP